VTAYRKRGSTTEDAQFLAGHADIRTSRLSDRCRGKITRNIVERIPT
jgi:integrase/recombinase XerD